MNDVFTEMREKMHIEIDPMIQEAILSFKEPTDFTLIALLIACGPLSFSEILEEMQINPTILNRVLDRLINGALVNNFYAKKANSKKHSFYEATNLAKKLIQKLQELQEVKKEDLLSINLFYTPGSEISSIQKELSGVINRLEQLKRYTSAKCLRRETVETVR